ncbi:MAG: Vi polysaccharide biosynthesis protein VipB/TviC [Bacteroidetes bacterium GWF2_38_335]|nr:MAG: Vi polysaccharide biosynthesis protein VipB/TviC [Bacteroidetes bacterium GWF2_38_335]OFY77483.1 MAG: Vi polysaccharide biosynthesis protein VipB/TviC [Bacteroidetes bacterium RIFOXYA12_FULL_38_20]HBS87225.1 LPS biosynthesis protein WbpP [Bacteroidales bacterium]
MTQNNMSLITKKRVLVTGGAGFIGSNLCEALVSQDNEVICLDNFITGKHRNIKELRKNTRFTFIEGDIRDLKICRKATDGVDIVLHQAALGSVPRSVNDPIPTNEINISGFLNMIMAARDGKVKRFVYAASSSAYGDSVTMPKVEDKTGKPLSPYAVTKYVNELYADVFARLYGMEVIGLRYFNVFGQKQDPEGDYAAVIPKFIMKMMKGERPEIYGDGLQSRDFTFVQNVVEINQKAALTENAEALNNVYNVAFGERITLIDLFNILKEYLSEYDSNIAAIEPVFTEPRMGDIPHSLASIDKARKLLAYNPQYDLRKGLKMAIDWYWNNLKEKD